jgi:L-alanine-DL-glutamate epimerase-like enolase superfamily enzyme
VEVSPQGTIAVTDGPGFGYEIDFEFLKSVTEKEETLR